MMSPRHFVPPRRDSVLDDDKYPPLNNLAEQIRICCIEPGAENSELRVTFRTANMVDVTGQYAAVSYVWGKTMSRKPIILNGHKHDVTQNLYNMLLRLRTPDLGESLWIDALCINQKDDREKDEQVKQMALIYSGAKEVLIAMVESTRPVIRDTGSHKLVEATIAGLVQGRHLDELVCFIPGHAKSTQSKAASALRRLLTSEWYTRLWTIQEICFASKARILCSGGTVLWKDLDKALERWNEHRDDCCKDIAKTLNEEVMTACYTAYLHIASINHVVRHRESQHLLSNMLLFQHLKVSIAKDKYWALRSLHPHPERLPTLDYSMDSRTVFTELARWTLKDTHSLRLLAWELHGRTKLPSW